jgi:hypothetical protein
MRKSVNNEMSGGYCRNLYNPAKLDLKNSLAKAGNE